MLRFCKPFAASLSVLVLLGIGAGHVRAATLTGPSAWTVTGGNDTLWGIQFTALDNSTLTGFDYNHRNNNFGNNGLFGTISLNDISTSTTVYTSPYGTDLPAVVAFAGLNVSLKSGDIYQLVATSNVEFGANDELYQYLVFNTPTITYPDSDADISVTQGVFNNNPGFLENFAWGAFNNITTTAAAVPEPGTYALLGCLGLTGTAFLRRKRAR